MPTTSSAMSTSRRARTGSPEFLAINPMGKIPTIVVEGTVITEAPAIIAWLADAHPDAGLAPPLGSTERGTWYRWLFFGGSCIEPAVADEMFKRPPVARKGAIGWGSIDDVIAAVEAACSRGRGCSASASARPMSTSVRSSAGRRNAV